MDSPDPTLAPGGPALVIALSLKTVNSSRPKTSTFGYGASSREGLSTILLSGLCCHSVSTDTDWPGCEPCTLYTVAPRATLASAIPVNFSVYTQNSMSAIHGSALSGMGGRASPKGLRAACVENGGPLGSSLQRCSHSSLGQPFHKSCRPSEAGRPMGLTEHSTESSWLSGCWNFGLFM